MTAMDNARAVIARYDNITAAGGYGAGDHHQLAAALRALIVEHEHARHALVTLAEGGLGFDLNPTMQMETMSGVYAQWCKYAERMDASVRKLARLALTNHTIRGTEHAD